MYSKYIGKRLKFDMSFFSKLLIKSKITILSYIIFNVLDTVPKTFAQNCITLVLVIRNPTIKHVVINFLKNCKIYLRKGIAIIGLIFL